jgi:U4/U6.U5 tri-snRNP-associated protein 1
VTNGDADIMLPAEESEGLVFDDTSEFVRSIMYDPESARVQNSKPPVHKEDMRDEGSLSPSPEREELEAGEVDMKQEENEEAALHAMQMDVDMNGIDIKKEANAEVSRHLTVSAQLLTHCGKQLGTSSEQMYGSGIANTLAILRQQGTLKPLTEEQKTREQTQRERDRWLAEHRATELQLEQERLRARTSGREQTTREYDNRKREQMEQRIMSESFKDYKPDVNIVYHDEFGRELTPKEAWKALSHRFHGKGSGKAKTEKRLKRIADEKKKEAMSSGDTPSNMNKAFQARQEKAGQAHMVLSVGNRG